jgi:RNA polymerase sigma-70 factor (ECF subfamily)
MHPDKTRHLEASIESPEVLSFGGDIEPWRRCYQQMSARLLLYARQVLYSGGASFEADAEDAVQTAFVRFWKRYPDAREDQYGLLFAAVRSVSLDMLRSSHRRIRREGVYSVEVQDFRDTAAPKAAGGAWFVESSDPASLPVQQALERLPAEQREVVVLKIWGELTFAQIAETLEISPNTAASRYRLALGALRKEVETNGRNGEE